MLPALSSRVDGRTRHRWQNPENLSGPHFVLIFSSAGTMTIKVELKPEIEAWLAAGARALGLSVEEYAERLLRDAAAVHKEPSGPLSVEEVRIMLKSLAGRALPPPKVAARAFTRESVLHDRP